MMTVLLLQFAATWFMVGVIWLVQLVHYPLFARVGQEAFAAYEAAHTSAITIVVLAPMILELATAVLLLFWRPLAVPAWSAWLGLLLVVVIWLSTLLLQVPQHGVLSAGFEAASHSALVRTNWIRTLAWSGRGLLLLWWIGRLLT